MTAGWCINSACKNHLSTQRCGSESLPLQGTKCCCDSFKLQATRTPAFFKPFQISTTCQSRSSTSELVDTYTTGGSPGFSSQEQNSGIRSASFFMESLGG